MSTKKINSKKVENKNLKKKTPQKSETLKSDLKHCSPKKINDDSFFDEYDESSESEYSYKDKKNLKKQVEEEIKRLFCEGYSAEEISKILDISFEDLESLTKTLFKNHVPLETDLGFLKFREQLYSNPEIVNIKKVDDAKRLAARYAYELIEKSKKLEETIVNKRFENYKPAEVLSKSEYTAIVAICDSHFFEKFEYRDTNYVNAYDKAIAKRRFSSAILKSASFLVNNIQPSEISVMFMGDIMNGKIHNESNYNDGESLLDTEDEVVDLIEDELSFLGSLIPIKMVGGVVGNHPRLDYESYDPRTMLRDNFDYHIMKRLYRRQKLVSDFGKHYFCDDIRPFTVPTVPLFFGNKVYFFTHGHIIKGGNSSNGNPINGAVKAAATTAAIFNTIIQQIKTGKRNIKNIHIFERDAYEKALNGYSVGGLIAGHHHSFGILSTPNSPAMVYLCSSLVGANPFSTQIISKFSNPGVTIYLFNKKTGEVHPFNLEID